MRKLVIFLPILVLMGCGGSGSSSGSQHRYQGSDDFVKAMQQAEHQYKASDVNVIIEGGLRSGDIAAYYKSQNVIRITEDWRIYDVDDLAGVLAHENTHARQPVSSSHEHAVQKELEAYAVQVRFLQSISRHDLAAKWASEDGTHVCRDW